MFHISPGQKSYYLPKSGPAPAQSQSDPEVVVTSAPSAIEEETAAVPSVPANTKFLEIQAKKRLTTISQMELPVLDDALEGVFPDEILLTIAQNDEMPDQELFLEENRPRLESILKSARILGNQEVQKHILRQAFAQKNIDLLLSIFDRRHGENLRTMLHEVAFEKTEFSTILATMKQTMADCDVAVDSSPDVMRRMLERSSRELRAMFLRVALNHGSDHDCMEIISVINTDKYMMDVSGQGLSGLRRHMGLDFTGLKLADTDLSDGNFGIEINPITYRPLPARSFTGDLAGIKFINSVCTRVSFSGDLTDANMTNADLSCAIFGSDEATMMLDANLTGAKMNGVKCHDVDMTGVVMSGGVVANEAEFNRSDMTLANMTGMIAGKAKFHSANLDRAVMEKVRMIGAEFIKANLSFADLRGADISRAKVDGANLDGADLRGANVAGVSLWKCKSWLGMIVDEAMLNTVDWFSKRLLVRAIERGEVILAPTEPQAETISKERS